MSEPVPLEYARRPRRWRLPWRRLLIAVALSIAAWFGSRRAMQAYHTLQARSAADRQLRSYFKQCLAHTQSDATPLFDETRDTCPILLDEWGPHGEKISEKYVRFRGDSGLEWPNDDWRRRNFRHAAFESSRMRLGLGWLNSRAAAKIWCAEQPLGGPPSVDHYGANYGELEAQNYELFVHGRCVRGGPERLVGVTFDASTFLAGNPTPLWVWVYSSPRPMLQGCSCRGDVRGLGFSCSASEPLRFFAGQPDPLDSSHFTVRYAVGKRHGVIDGCSAPMTRSRFGRTTPSRDSGLGGSHCVRFGCGRPFKQNYDKWHFWHTHFLCQIGNWVRPNLCFYKGTP